MAARLKDKRAIITGAASGIGASTAILFAEHECDLILLDIASMEDTLREIQKVAPKCNVLNFKCDVSSEEAIQDVVNSIQKRFGKSSIDILLNNAAAFIFKNVMDATKKEWNKMLSVNVFGAATMIQHIVPLMKYDGTSSIINIGSISGIRAQQPDRITYNVTKAAIIQLTKNAAVDLWDKYKIRVNCVCPGVVLTKAVADEAKWTISQGMFKDYAEYEKNWSTRLIMNNFGDPRDVSFACLFFATDESKYCTATHLMVDGGWSAL